MKRRRYPRLCDLFGQQSTLESFVQYPSLKRGVLRRAAPSRESQYKKLVIDNHPAKRDGLERKKLQNSDAQKRDERMPTVSQK